MESDSIRDYLLDYVYSKNRVLRYSAIVALGLTDFSSGSRKDLDLVTNLLGSSKIDDVIFGLYYFGLAFFRTTEDINHVLMIKNVSSQRIVEALLWGLGLAYFSTENKRIENFFMSWLHDKNMIRRAYGLLGVGLVTFGTQSKSLISSLSILANNPNTKIRQNAMLALGLSFFDSSNPEVKNFLRGLLASERNLQMRLTIIKALGLLGFGTRDEDLTRALQIMVNQLNIAVVESAIKSLALIYFVSADETFINIVSNLLGQKNPRLHTIIAESLGYVYFGAVDADAKNVI